MDDQRRTEFEKAKAALEALLAFDTSKLSRIDELGSVLNFSDAVEPANQLTSFYRELPPSLLESIPITPLRQFRDVAERDINQLKGFLQDRPETIRNRDDRIQALRNAFDDTFTKLHSLVSYSIRKPVEFAKLEGDARAYIESATQALTALRANLAHQIGESERILATVKQTSELQGVSQQAIYFKTEADSHDLIAKKWLYTTISLTAVLGLFAVSTLFLHKWDVLTPTTTVESVQFSMSKIFIFATVSFILALSAKNYSANRHNAVVNRHRQNALATYQAIVNAGGDQTNRDIVLGKAADCIFSAQPTGFGKVEQSEGGGGITVNVPSAVSKPPE